MAITDNHIYRLIHGNTNIYNNFDHTKYEDIMYGWNSDHQFFREIIRDKNPEYILEIGSWLGRSAINMGNFIKENSLKTKIVCVDTWLGSMEFIGDRFPADRDKLVKNGIPRAYDYFLANVKKYGLEDIIIPFPQISSTALRFFMINNIFFDLIYVDGSNYFEDIQSDIDLSWNVLKPNGMMFGDDYRNYNWPHIAMAVNEFVNNNKLMSEFEVKYDCYWTIKKKIGELKYVITSHPKYAKALEYLLDSMAIAGVKPANIIVVLGDCDISGKHIKEEIKIRPGINYVPIENNIYEYNFFVGVMKAIELGICKRIDDFVLIHDTCIVGNRFIDCVQDFSRSPEQIIWNNKVGCFNIGIFKYAAVKEGYNLYRQLKSLNKHDAIMMEHNRHHLSPKRFPVSQKFAVLPPKRNTSGHFAYHDVYGEGRTRTVAWIPVMDLVKFFFWVPHGDVHPNNIEN